MSENSEIASEDGSLRFAVRPVAGAVQVTRRQKIEGRGNVTLVLRFQTVSELARFCDEDELRFNYQATFERLRRSVAMMLAEGGTLE